jgi:PAS domain S-box-containing protein
VDEFSLREPKKRTDRFRRIFERYSAFLGIFILFVGVFIISWKALTDIKREIRKNIWSNLQTTLKTTDEAIVGWAGERLDDLNLLITRPDVNKLIEALNELPPDQETLRKSVPLNKLRDIMRPFLLNHHHLGFFVINKERISTGSMRDINLGSVNLLDAVGDYLDKIFSGEPQLILPIPSDVALPNLSGRLSQKEPTMFVGTPVFNSKGEVIAAFTIRLNPSLQFTRITQIPRSGDTGDSYAFNKAGVLITECRFDDQLRRLGLIGPDERAILTLKLRDPGGNMLEGYLPKKKRKALPFTKGVRSALTGKFGIDIDGYRDYRGVPVVGAWDWIEKYNFGLIYEVDVDEAYVSYFKIRNIVIFVLSFIGIMFCGYSLALYMRKRKTEVLNQRLGQEIVERKKMNRALKESEKKFRNIFESSKDAMTLLSKTGFVDGNDAALKMFSCRTIGEFTGKQPGEFSPPLQSDGRSSHEAAQEKVTEAYRNGKNFFEWTHKRANGEVFQAEVLLTPVTIEAEDLILGVTRDITDRKKIELELKQSEERIRIILETADDAIITINAKGIVQSFNSAAERLLGYEASEVVGQNIKMLAPEPHHSRHDDYIANYLKTGIRKIIGIGREAEVQRKDGEIRPIYLSVGEGDFGEQKIFTGIIHDITKIKEAERTLTEANERLLKLSDMKSEFISVVSHELRTPLTSIKNAVTLVNSEKTGQLNANQSKFMSMAERNIDRLTRLVNDLLDLSRMEAGKMQLNFEQLDLISILQRAAETFEPRAEAKSITFERAIEGSLPFLHADSDRIDQILANLLDNAVKFTPKGGRITLSARRTAEMVEVSVADTGPGLSAENRKHIFEQFYQTEDTLTRKTGGSGLGLSIVKQLIEAHKGKISVESEEGQGARFIFILPVLLS